MNERIIIHASRKKKLFLVTGLVLFFLLALFLLKVTPLHPNPVSYFIYRSMGALTLLLIIGLLPRMWEVLTKPILVIDEVGVHLTRVTIPWQDVRDIRCENSGQWIYLTVHPPEKYRRLNRASKRWGYQREDEVFLNFSPSAREDYFAACRVIRHVLIQQ